MKERIDLEKRDKNLQEELEIGNKKINIGKQKRKLLHKGKKDKEKETEIDTEVLKVNSGNKKRKGKSLQIFEKTIIITKNVY